MTKKKQFFCKCVKNAKLKNHIYISIQTQTQNFVEVPLAVITALSLLGYDTTSLAHLYLGSFFSADPLKLCPVGGGVLLHSYFQVSPEMFDRVQVRALVGSLKDMQQLVPKPRLRCLGCVL